MSILERLVDNSQRDTHDDDTVDLTTQDAPDVPGEPDGGSLALVEPQPALLTDDRDRDRDLVADPDTAEEPLAAEAEELSRDGRPVGVRGMRIQRVRLRSVATIAAVFFALGYLTIVGTLVVVWNAMRALGFVDSFEETVTTALGLEQRFTMAGGDLFGMLLVGTALLMLVGLLLTVLLALVYNVACAVFGGLAVETGPLRRRRRVFSWRHRGFITIRH